jgi:AbrB family looped-hinge helix DNA binding protein
LFRFFTFMIFLTFGIDDFLTVWYTCNGGDPMTITLTAKNQITIPSKIAKTLGLKKGALFTIGVNKNKIELIPVEIREKEFSPEVYAKLDALNAEEKGKEKKITKSFIKNLTSGK